MFTTRVVRQIEAAHHNGPPGSKCYTNHGHSWTIITEFQIPDKQIKMSDFGWGVDFHLIKSVIDEYDHQDLNRMFQPPSAELLAMTLYDRLKKKTGFTPAYVEVHEGSGNSVRYSK